MSIEIAGTARAPAWRATQNRAESNSRKGIGDMFRLACPTYIWLHRHAQRVSIPYSTQKHEKLCLESGNRSRVMGHPFAYRCAQHTRPEETPAIAMFKLRIVLRLLVQADFWQVKR
jgi:hypothetical protein